MCMYISGVDSLLSAETESWLRLTLCMYIICAANIYILYCKRSFTRANRTSLWPVSGCVPFHGSNLSLWTHFLRERGGWEFIPSQSEWALINPELVVLNIILQTKMHFISSVLGSTFRWELGTDLRNEELACKMSLCTKCRNRVTNLRNSWD